MVVTVRKQVELVRYIYPNSIILSVKGKHYEYESSEFFCRRLMDQLDKGAQFMALNWFKRVATLKGRR